MMDQKPSRPAPVQKEYLPPVSRSFVASPGERLARWVLDMKLSPPDTPYKTPGDYRSRAWRCTVRAASSSRAVRMGCCVRLEAAQERSQTRPVHTASRPGAGQPRGASARRGSTRGVLGYAATPWRMTSVSPRARNVSDELT